MKQEKREENIVLRNDMGMNRLPCKLLLKTKVMTGIAFNFFWLLDLDFINICRVTTRDPRTDS